MKQKTLALILATLLLIWVCIPRHKPNPYKVESIIDYESGVIFHYPVTGKEALDKSIKSFVDQTISEYVAAEHKNTSLNASFGCYSSVFTLIRFKVTINKEGTSRDSDTKKSWHKNFIVLWGDSYVPVSTMASTDNKETVSPEPVPKTGKKQIAITFDDGPSSYTSTILDLLDKHDFKATFFVLGMRVDSHRDIIARMKSSGNEIGNHTFNHEKLTTLEPKQINAEISKTQEAVKSITGVYPKYLRPTYGAFNSKVRDISNMPLLMWNKDTMDWKSKNADYVFSQATASLKDGDIILFHDIYPSTVEAIEKLLPYLESNGFEAVTVSQLFEGKSVSPEDGIAYFSTSSKT